MDANAGASSWPPAAIQFLARTRGLEVPYLNSRDGFQDSLSILDSGVAIHVHRSA